MRKRGELLQAARSEVYANGYNFKKGQSRSKRFKTDTTSVTPKRPKLNKDIRETRIQDLNEELNDIKQRISFKEKRVDCALNLKNFKVCDGITGEITELKEKRRKLLAELKQLNRKDKRARKYKESTSSRTPSGLSSDDECTRKSPWSSSASSVSASSPSPFLSPTHKSAQRRSSRSSRSSVSLLPEPQLRGDFKI